MKKGLLYLSDKYWLNAIISKWNRKSCWVGYGRIKLRKKEKFIGGTRMGSIFPPSLYFCRGQWQMVWVAFNASWEAASLLLSHYFSSIFIRHLTLLLTLFLSSFLITIHFCIYPLHDVPSLINKQITICIRLLINFEVLQMITLK